MAGLNFSPGDKVRLRLALKELDGVVLENAQSEVLLLKLDSGYNVGIPKENILAGRVLKKFVEDKKKFFLPKPDKKLKSIGLVVTGGTIASKLDARTGGVAPLTDVSEFANFYPEIFKIANVKKIVVPFMTASESMSSEHWLKIGNSVEELLNDSEIEGVVVTHGTDFLHYTSAVLSFFFVNLNKPVVLTYAQRSVDRASSDANLNLQCAAQMALSNCAEVVLVGHGSTNDDFCFAIRGTKVRKLHTSRRDAFKSVNDKPIAKVFSDKVEFISGYNVKHEGKVRGDFSFNDKVALVKFYPGQDSSILDFYALKYKGIIIEGSGLGHLPVGEQGNDWSLKLKKHIRNGFVVCITSQCIFGRVDPFVYSNGRKLLDAGVVFLEDMLAETAFVKLGWILGHYGWKKNVKEKMLENLAGEINEKLPIM
ncbi:Glu-tRNA(Gln) amidotransferase subunit GatD [Candidatus Pacearchaeota archaeon]|nr:Glu-tRNA(Gln) amidotransferase subunit GatD [Candidatus Pacearchaeota archaeon]